MLQRPFTVRFAEKADEPEISSLVVEGFLDKFRPAFGKRLDASAEIMERWISLEHIYGGVSTLVIDENGRVAASLGLRLGQAQEEIMSGELWRVFRKHMGYLRALRATILLSYPRYIAHPSEGYIERLVVSPEHRRSGMAHALMERAELIAREQECHAMGLHVSVNNLSARMLYQELGYSEVSRQRSLLTHRFMGVREWLYLRKSL